MSGGTDGPKKPPASHAENVPDIRKGSLTVKSSIPVTEKNRSTGMLKNTLFCRLFKNAQVQGVEIR